MPLSHYFLIKIYHGLFTVKLPLLINKPFSFHFFGTCRLFLSCPSTLLHQAPKWSSSSFLNDSQIHSWTSLNIVLWFALNYFLPLTLRQGSIVSQLLYINSTTYTILIKKSNPPLRFKVVLPCSSDRARNKGSLREKWAYLTDRAQTIL